jgi:hypothetical protein
VSKFADHNIDMMVVIVEKAQYIKDLQGHQEWRGPVHN